MKTETKQKKAKCYNCKHAGKQFKIIGKTHLHCEHPIYTKERFESGEFSPWDTLKEFWNTCNDHEFKS
ncbi:hypothetical protein [Spongiimicrobium salis]|uniref:hypothetical protein n=1 Tax=Spongiimicrobium salis TaxID=1667022 RepID=UPI00374DCD42